MTEEIIAFETPAAWEEWLAREHESQRGVWVRIAKKATGILTVTHAEALDVALCYGWIDGQRKTFDAQWFIQRFTPRTARSTWSKVNREKVARLTADGRMRAAGMREVERAKADGRWDAAYDPPSTATVPPDLLLALEADPTTLAAFFALNSQTRFAILFRVQQAKRPETRARRIATFVAMLAAGEKPYP